MASELSLSTNGADVRFLRWAGLTCVLLAEVLFITIRFDSASLSGQDGVWTRLLERANIVPQLLIVAVTATLVFGGGELSHALMRLSRRTYARHRWLLWCIIQLALFAVFVPLTTIVFERQSDLETTHLFASAAWAGVGLLILVSWCCAMLPPASYLEIASQHRWLLVGAAFIGVVAWAAGQFADSLWIPLGQSTLWLVAGLLGALGVDIVTPRDFVIGTPNFTVYIAPACSGYEGIGLAWVFVGTYLWWARNQLRWPNACLLLPLATGLMWFSNGLRIASLILIGSYGWKGVALGGFHSQAGWLAFNAIALGLVVVSRRSRIFSVASTAEQESEDASLTAAYLMPLLALMATIMVTSALSSGFDWLYPLRIVAVAICVIPYAQHYARCDWTWSWIATGIGILTGGMWIALEVFATPQSEPNSMAVSLSTIPAGWALVWIVMRIIGSVFAAPVAEELAFRGFLLRRFISADWADVPTTQFSFMSLLASSALFGALHPGRWLAGSLAGVLFALALYRRGNVLDAVLAHATANAVIAGYVLSTGSWNLWS